MNLSEHLSQEQYKKYVIKLAADAGTLETKTVRFYNEGIAVLAEKTENQEKYRLIPFSQIDEVWCDKNA